MRSVAMWITASMPSRHLIEVLDVPDVALHQLDPGVMQRRLDVARSSREPDCRR